MKIKFLIICGLLIATDINLALAITNIFLKRAVRDVPGYTQWCNESINTSLAFGAVTLAAAIILALKSGFRFQNPFRGSFRRAGIPG